MNSPFILLILVLLLLGRNTFSQSSSTRVYDTSHRDNRLNNPRYYGKTDFNVVDTISYWRYSIDSSYRGADSSLAIQPIARLAFWRAKPIYDSLHERVYRRQWVPNIIFDIYNISDSAFCYGEASWVRVISSCVPPAVGGDLLLVGRFVLLNNRVCVQCVQSTSRIDYCRPVLQSIFSSIDVSRVISLHTLLLQLAIPEGDLKQLEK